MASGPTPEWPVRARRPMPQQDRGSRADRRVSARLSANPAALAAQQSRLRPHRTVSRTVYFDLSRKRHKDLLDPYIW